MIQSFTLSKARAGLGIAFLLPCVISLGIVPAAHAEAAPISSPVSTVPDDLEAAGIAVDASFDGAGPVTIVGPSSSSTVRAVCPDRAATALTFWQQSGQGCAVIGTTSSTQVYFKWYLHRGSASAVSVLARGFNSKAVPTFYECGNGTGRTKAIPWGKVASAKYIKMLANKGWGGIQWS